MLSNYLKKKGILILMMILWLSNGFAQQNQTIPGSFSIVGEENQTKKTFYVQSIEKADMEQFRLKEKDVVLKFKEGFECVLYSAKNLFSKGINVNINEYKSEFAAEYTLPVFSITANGHLLAEFPQNKKYKSN